MSVVRTPTETDKSMGLLAEKLVIPIVSKEMNRDYKKTSEYCGYDAEDNKGNRLEIKSRKYRYDDFDTTFLTIKKSFHKGIGDLHFVFKFQEGDIYIIKYNKEIFDKFKICYNMDKGISTPNYKIPIRLLNRLR